MAWKIFAYMEGRSGHLAVLPESLIGEPNAFGDGTQAMKVAQAMQAQLGGDKSPIRYLAIPALDAALHRALVAHQPQPQPQQPAVSFSGPPPAPPTPPAASHSTGYGAPWIAPPLSGAGGTGVP